MRHATTLVCAALLAAAGCTMMTKERLEDIVPTHMYHRPYSQVFEQIKLYSLKEGFTLDRYGVDAGRVIGHKATTSSGAAKQLSSTAENTLVIMNLKVRRVDTTSTEVIVNFAFENGHVVVSREEETILLDCYHTFFAYMKDEEGS